jgi:hypothetical protein
MQGCAHATLAIGKADWFRQWKYPNHIKLLSGCIMGTAFALIL